MVSVLQTSFSVALVGVRSTGGRSLSVTIGRDSWGGPEGSEGWGMEGGLERREELCDTRERESKQTSNSQTNTKVVTETFRV